MKIHKHTIRIHKHNNKNTQITILNRNTTIYALIKNTQYSHHLAHQTFQTKPTISSKNCEDYSRRTFGTALYPVNCCVRCGLLHIISRDCRYRHCGGSRLHDYLALKTRNRILAGSAVLLSNRSRVLAL